MVRTKARGGCEHGGGGGKGKEEKKIIKKDTHVCPSLKKEKAVV